MANTYTQLYVHIIFAVKGRHNQIHKSFQDILYKYIHGIIVNRHNKVIAIDGMPDHIHLLIGLNPESSISGLVRDIKHYSTIFINEKNG